MNFCCDYDEVYQYCEEDYSNRQCSNEFMTSNLTNVSFIKYSLCPDIEQTCKE